MAGWHKPTNKKEAPQLGLLRITLAEFAIGSRLATYAANAASADDVDHVSDVLNARHVPNRFLYELLQVKRRQLAGQY
jgi:hypothetical protein